MHGRIIFGLVLLLGGCAELPAPTREQDESETPLGLTFDPVATGAIRGRVVWDGDAPASEEYLIRAIAYNPYLHQKPARFATPHLPKVHAENRGVANAVVYLRGVDPHRSRPWDHARVRVEFHDRQLLVRQG